MSNSSDIVPQSGPGSATPAAMPIESAVTDRRYRSRPYYWSVRRELWENRSIYIAPLIVAAVELVGFFVSIIGLPERRRAALLLEPLKQRAAIELPYDMVAMIMILTAFIVGLFYCLDALHGERRERSILFWKSLPVSDLATVLTKASIPIVILPLLAVVIALITEWMMLLISTATLLIRGQAVWAFWSRLPIFTMWSGMLFHFFCVHGLWQSPIYGWLIMVSAWARRVPILWAVLPPLAIGFCEKAAFNTAHFGDLIGSRFTGGPEGSAIMEHTVAGTNMMPSSAHFFISPGLWIGFAITAAFLAAAVRLRRYRGPN